MAEKIVEGPIDKDLPENHEYDYDLIVIGGGSGGLATSKQAAKYGKKVAVLDFVSPSPLGTRWGLGGTCVNVGCIPKKLMHHAAILGEKVDDAKEYGWENVEEKKHNWETLVQAVGDHIGSLNWGYKVALRDNKVEYINGLGTFVDEHTVEVTMKNKTKKNLSARRFVVCVGGRPRYPDIPGAKEHCLTSDDIFQKYENPGKTLVVGASYVALECAGFIKGLGYDTTVMVRSILLRGFDQQIAEMIGEYMSNHGVKFIRPATPSKIEEVNGKKVVTFTVKGENGETEEKTEEYDTVLMAVGRYPDTQRLNLDKVGVALSPSNKVYVKNERTTTSHIYAIGDICEGGLELTPVAIKQGILLANRLYDDSNENFDWNVIPTTVFTPLEYGCIGLSEEDAIKKYSEENLEIYHSHYKPLEWTVSHREDNVCYMKVICNIVEDEKIVGIHVLGDHAGEITQGYALGMRLGATKRDLDMTVGIHPTSSEEFTTIKVTKRSGLPATKSGC